MPQYEIQAEAGLVLGSVEPNFIQLGCFDCLFKEAQGSCITNYHLCNNVEMYSGVYQAVRIMGWVNQQTIFQLESLIFLPNRYLVIVFDKIYHIVGYFGKMINSKYICHACRQWKINFKIDSVAAEWPQLHHIHELDRVWADGYRHQGYGYLLQESRSVLIAFINAFMNT
jgi:hypothetical protein